MSGPTERGLKPWFVSAFGIVLIVCGTILMAGGIWLISLRGSWYYLLAGLALIGAGYGVFRGRLWGFWLYFFAYAFTWAWSLWEVGFNGWALVPRLVGPTVLFIAALFLTPTLRRVDQVQIAVGGITHNIDQSLRGITSVIILVLAVTGIAVGFTTRIKAQENLTTLAGHTLVPSEAALATDVDWPAYGGTNHALRYSALNQINPTNVSKLERAWVYRTGDMPDKKTEHKYSPETTPLKVADRVFLCSAKNILISLDAATGQEKWRYDPKVPDDAIPYGATCRGVSYYKAPSATPGQLCGTRILEGTLDARLIAVDADTGKLCDGFGDNGTVNLMEGIGESAPGWYGNVAAPTIVRNVIVLGAQVQDGQAEDAPSG